MEKRTKIYALILLVLCLAVPAVNAVDIVISQGTYNLGDINNNIQHFTVKDVISLGSVVAVSNCQITNIDTNSKSFDAVLYTSTSTASFKISGIYMPPQVYESTITVNYNYQESIPEPPEPYITATVYNTGENNLYYDYNVRCMPEQGYLFAPLSFTPYSFIVGFGQTPSYTQTSEETLIQVRVFAGGDVSMYSSALNAIDNSDYQHLSIVLTAPVYTAGDVVNNQTVHEELQNIPNPVTPSGGIVSGAWQPLALKQDLAVVNTPFSYIVDNYLHYFHFPEMATPETVKAGLLNGTGNLTAPLYDSIDGLTSVFMILPNYVSGVLTGLITPISETVILVKNVILTLSDYVYNAMSVLYVFIPFIYLFIPDVIWWGLTIYLAYLVFAWLLTLLFGYDVISVFYIDPFVSWVRSRRGGE